MLSVGAMLLAICAFVGAAFCFIAGGVLSWVALALMLVSMAFEAAAFVLAETEEVGQ